MKNASHSSSSSAREAKPIDEAVYTVRAMRAALQVLFGCLQVETWLLLIAASVHLLRAASWAAGRAMRDETPPLDGELPLVTVQLPICNERAVAERVMRAACALDW